MISGYTLRLLRTWKGLAQKQAADLLNISQPAYSKLEKKKLINNTVLERIRTAFKCSDAEIRLIQKLVNDTEIS